ncbi:hypothetical protein VPH35_036515 [Triticum aestivum]
MNIMIERLLGDVIVRGSGLLPGQGTRARRRRSVRRFKFDMWREVGICDQNGWMLIQECRKVNEIQERFRQLMKAVKRSQECQALQLWHHAIMELSILGKT